MLHCKYNDDREIRLEIRRRGAPNPLAQSCPRAHNTQPLRYALNSTHLQKNLKIPIKFPETVDKGIESQTKGTEQSKEEYLADEGECLSSKDAIKKFIPNIHSSTCSLSSCTDPQKANSTENQRISPTTSVLSVKGINTESFNLSDSAIGLNSVACSSINTNNNPEISSLLDSFSNLIEQTLFQNGRFNCEKLAWGTLMRSASSAGETTTNRCGQDLQSSVPKRAETFNGASSKDITMTSTINELLRTRLYKTSVSSSGCVPHSHTNSDISADSGYQSRLCVDSNHDTDGESCFCSCENHSSGKNGECQASQANLAKEQFENFLKCFLTDYIRLKDENCALRSDLESKSKQIEQLQKTIESNKVLYDFILWDFCYFWVLDFLGAAE